MFLLTPRVFSEHIAGCCAAQQVEHVGHVSGHRSRHQPAFPPTKQPGTVAAGCVIEAVWLTVADVETRPESPRLS